MPRIGIISGAFEVDHTSQELLDRASEVAEAAAIDPIDFKFEESRYLAGERRLDKYDALIVRLLNPQGDSDFQFDFLLRLAEKGVVLINKPQATAIAESKFLTNAMLSEAGLPIPPTLISQNVQQIMEFVEVHRDVVVKPLYGFQGYDVIRVNFQDEDGAKQVGRLVEEDKVVLAQPFLPNPGRDIRAFVVGDRVVASIYRLAPEGEWKTNVRSGANVVEHELPKKAREMCVKAAEIIGLDYTGVDLIEGPDGLMILEVNGAPAWSGVEMATGVDIAKSIIDLTLRILEKKSPKHV